MSKLITHIEHGGGAQNPTSIVIHCMGEYIADGRGGFDHAVPFLNKYKLSAHSLIAPDGSNYRCREDNEGAWHARGFNKNSLGIEFLVQGDHDYGSFVDTIKNKYLTEIQYQAGVAQVREWMSKYDIARIDRHSDISPGRKVDPGAGFPWRRFIIDIGWEDDK